MIKPLRNGNQHLLPILILAITSILAVLFFQQTQSPLTHRGGMGWDGGHYYSLAQQIIDDAPITGAKPLVYRIGTPALVAMLVKLGVTSDIMEGFFLVNAGFAFANIFLVYFIISRFVDPWVALVGGILFPLHWINPARHIFFTPLMTDPGGLFFLYLGLALLIVLQDRRKTLSFALMFITFIGMLFREFVLVLPVLFMLVQYPPRTMLENLRARARGRMITAAWPLLPPFLGGFASLLLVRLLVESQTSYSFWKAAMFYFWTNSPQSYLFTGFSVFGLAIIFLILRAGFILDYLKSQPVILYFVGIIFVVGFIGGDTNVRYLSWAFPFFFVLIAKSITAEGIPRWAIAALIAFYLVFVCRLPWQTADYSAASISPFPIFTYLTEDFRFLDLYVLHARKNVAGIIFYQYLLTCSALIVMLRWRQIRDWLRRWLAPRIESTTDEAGDLSSPAKPS